MNVTKLAQLSGHNAAIFALADGRVERHFLTGAGDGWVVEWDLDQPDLGRLLAKVERQVFALLFLKNLNKVVAGNMDGGVHWIDLGNPDNTRNVAHHTKGVFAIEQVGNQVFTIGGDGKLSRWEVEKMRPSESYQLSNQSLRCIDVSESRNELAVGSSDGAIYLLDADTLELRQKIVQAHGSSVFSICYDPNGRHLLSGGRDAHLNAWDLQNNFEKISSQPAHWYTINSICFSPDGRHFATGSRDKTVKIWNTASIELVKVLEGGRDGGHFNSVNKLMWISQQNLISCSDDRTAIIWRIND